MQTKKLKSWFEIPTLGIWTWKIGGDFEADFSKDKEYVKEIRRALDSWITLIDTAEMYGKGHVEEVVGQAIKGYDRSKLFITSKVFKTNLHYDDVIKAAEKSLERLWTDYLDLYLIHSPNPDIEMKETIDALNYLFDKWIIKNIWVSNFTKERLELAQSMSKAKIVLNQCHYNLIYREPELSELNTYCIENDIIMQAWRPVQFGEIISNNIEIMDTLAKKYWKTYSQIAINWLISQENITTITKMSKQEHIDENINALWWEMDKEDIESLRKNYPDQIEKSDRVPLK